MTCPSHVFPWPLSQIIDNVVPKYETSACIGRTRGVGGGRTSRDGDTGCTVKDRRFQRNRRSLDWNMYFRPSLRD